MRRARAVVAVVALVMPSVAGAAPPPDRATRPLPRPVPRNPEILLDTDVERPNALDLERTPEGGFFHRDPRGRFEATIAPDGKVRFTVPEPPLQMRICVLGRCTGDPQSEKVRRALKQPPSERDRVLAVSDIPGAIGSLLGAEVSFGPVKVSKLAETEFLNRTFKLRATMAVGWYRTEIRKQLHRLDSQLLLIWSDRSTPLDRRKELLFRRWDECAEGIGPSAMDQPAEVEATVDSLRREAGAMARGRIEAFVRRHAPQGSSRGYTSDEVDRLNRTRTSAQPFDPYSP